MGSAEASASARPDASGSFPGNREKGGCGFRMSVRHDAADAAAQVRKTAFCRRLRHSPNKGRKGTEAVKAELLSGTGASMRAVGKKTVTCSLTHVESSGLHHLA